LPLGELDVGEIGREVERAELVDLQGRVPDCHALLLDVPAVAGLEADCERIEAQPGEDRGELRVRKGAAELDAIPGEAPGNRHAGQKGMVHNGKVAEGAGRPAV